jgi:hypothetical protein
VEIKEILYAEINKIGKNHIRTLLSDDISNSKTVISLLLNNCTNLLNKNNPLEDELILFAEALLHFVLTVSMIPAERKISVGDVAIDVLVPNSKNLKADNDKAILIHFFKDKDENIDESISKLSRIQKNTNNIWIVSSKKIKNLNLNTFIISQYYSNNDVIKNFNYPFSVILIKIDEFLKNINYSGLKIF